MKKIVIIGANDFQKPLILKAKEMGYETHVFAWREGAIGAEDADFFYEISIVEMDEILEECRRIKPDAVATIGSDLANMINEAAILAVKNGRRAVSQKDLQESVEVVLVGKEKKDRILSVQERRIVSYHEVGHALVNALQKDAEPVQKITIVPRTMGALGYVMQVPEEEKYLNTQKELEAMLVGYLGGRAAEELVFDTVTTGAANDIEQATKLARALVTRYGMTEDFDMVALETVNNAYLGGDASLACSEQTAAQVDAKVVEIVQAEHKKAYQMLADNKRKLDEIAQYLYEKETISGEEFMRILNAQPQLPAGPSADSTNQAQ